MKNPSAQLTVVLFLLGALALFYFAPQALHRGNIALFVALLLAAMICWKRLQGKQS